MMLKRTTRKRKWTEAQLLEAARTSRSVRQVLSKLGLREAGGNYRSIKMWIAHYGIDISHFDGMGWCHTPPIFRWSLEDILVEDSSYTNTHKLKGRLLQEGLLQARCYVCGLTQWREQPIPLELEHKNGCNCDNRLENLELLCPNCHAQTATYRGKNKKKPG